MAHDLTRAANPEVKHCQWLTDSPVACEELPNSIGAEFAGKVCPNNPYHKYREQHEQFAEMRDLLEDAFRIDDIADLGMFPDLSIALPEEFTAARIMRQHRRAEEMNLRMQAAMMGGSDG